MIRQKAVLAPHQEPEYNSFMCNSKKEKAQVIGEGSDNL